MNCSTTIIRSASMCLYPLKYCHLELDQEFSVFNARSGVTYGLGCQKKGRGFQCDPFNNVNESTMSGFVGAYRDELSALPFLNRSVDDIQQWQLDVNHLVSEKCPDSCSAQLCSSLFVQLVVNLNQLSIPIAGNIGGSDQEDGPDIRMILLVLAGGLIMVGVALLFYLKLPMVKCMSGSKSDVGAPLIFDPEVGGAPVEPNAGGDELAPKADGGVAGGEPSTVGGVGQLESAPILQSRIDPQLIQRERVSSDVDPVEPNADGDVAGGEPSTVGGGRQVESSPILEPRIEPQLPRLKRVPSGGDPVEPNAVGDVAGGEPSTVGGFVEGVVVQPRFIALQDVQHPPGGIDPIRRGPDADSDGLLPGGSASLVFPSDVPPLNRESTPITGPRHEPHSLLSEGDQGSMAPEEQDANPMYSRGQDEAAGGRLSQPGVSASLVFDSDGALLDGEAMPITGSRHEPNSLLSEGDQGGVNPVLQDANPMYSSGQDGAAGGRLNESEVFEAGLSSSLVFDSDGHPVDGEGRDEAAGGRLNESELFEAGLSSSLVFDSDGHPVDGGDIPTPRRRIDFSPFRISSSLTYGDGQPIEVSTPTPSSRLPSFIPFSGNRQPSRLDLSLMFPTPSTPKFRSPRSTPRTHSSDEAVSSVNASLGYVTPQHRAPDSSGGKTLPMLDPPQGVPSEQVSPLQDSSTPRDELLNKERPSKGLRKRARSASVEPKQKPLDFSNSTPIKKFTPFEANRNLFTASKNDVVFVSGKRRRRSILRSASKSGSSLTKSVSRLANLDDIRKQLLDRSQLRREKQESKLVALNQPDHSLQDQDVLQDTEAGVNVPSTLVAGPPFLTPTPLTPQTDDELSDPQGDEETETAANVNAKFSDLRTAP